MRNNMLSFTRSSFIDILILVYKLRALTSDKRTYQLFFIIDRCSVHWHGLFNHTVDCFSIVFLVHILLFSGYSSCVWYDHFISFVGKFMRNYTLSFQCSSFSCIFRVYKLRTIRSEKQTYQLFIIYIGNYPMHSSYPNTCRYLNC